LQVCVTYSARGRLIRIIGDPLSGFVRTQTPCGEPGCVLVDFTATGAPALGPICRQILDQVLPGREHRNTLTGGLFWLAAGLDGGTAFYANTRWGRPADRWTDAENCVKLLLPDAHASISILRALRDHAVLASTGLEGKTRSDARAKLYWRLVAPRSLEQMGVPLLDDSALGQFLTLLISDEAIPLSGLVFSAGFGLTTGALSDVKIDLCAHCLPKSPAVWVRLLETCCRIYRLPPFDIAEGILEHACELAVVGLGLSAERQPRLNVYLKASSSSL
jgi:hypothetical protein